MSGLESGSPAAPGADKPTRQTWREEILQPLPWFLITFGTSQLVEFLAQKTGAVTPAAIQKLASANEAFARGVAAVQPWQGAALFWQKLTSNWPPDLQPAGIPFYLFGKSFGVGLEVILLMLAAPATAVPAAIGYGLGLLVTWRLFGDDHDGLNPLLGVLGTIFLGGLCLLVLQPVMLGASALAGALLGTVSAGLAVLISLPLALAGSLLKHLVQTGLDTGIQKGLAGKGAAGEDQAAHPAPAPHPRQPKGTGVLPSPESGASTSTASPDVGEKAVGAARARRLYPWALVLFGSGILATLFGLDRGHPFLVAGLCWSGVLLTFVAWRIEAGDRKQGK